ncbi:neurobeachin-like [Gorilla gorilla gorilla]|uniref:neurobeachin-like n=1 Tax=Gorilla gorilla gorilla TaxID=9595 RepID=UPI00300871DE
MKFSVTLMDNWYLMVIWLGMLTQMIAMTSAFVDHQKLLMQIAYSVLNLLPFSEALSPAQILAIHQLGPRYKSSRVHVTRPVLEQFLSFAKYLGGLSHGAPLLKQLCDHILFINPAIWIHTPAKVQLSLYTYLSAEFIGTATIYTTIRRIGTVLKIMHTLKYYYWVINPADSSGITPKGLDFGNYE